MFSCRNSRKSKEREKKKNKEVIFHLRTITFFAQCFVKFIYSQKATKFCRILALLLSYVVPVKSKVKISEKNFWAFSEYMNFPFPIQQRLFFPSFPLISQIKPIGLIWDILYWFHLHFPQKRRKRLWRLQCQRLRHEL